MTGHEPLIAMRRSGFKPSYVWLKDAGLAPSDHEVCIAQTDIPEALDMRFLVGVTVLAESSDRDRLERMLKACVAAKAARVVGTHYQKTPHGRAEIIETTDTEEVMTWPK